MAMGWKSESTLCPTFGALPVRGFWRRMSDLECRRPSLESNEYAY